MKLWDKLRTCSVEKVFFEISQNLPESPVWNLFFNKAAGLRPETLLKGEYRCFQVNFVEFFKNTFLQNPVAAASL